MKWSFGGNDVDGELLDLFDAYCDGVASPAELARLEQWLAADSQAMDAFVVYVDMHARLQRWARRTGRTEAILQTGEVLSCGSAGEPGSNSTASTSSNTGQTSPPPLLGFLNEAAERWGPMFTDPYRFGGVLLIAVLMFVSGYLVSPKVRLPEPAPVATRSATVAADDDKAPEDLSDAEIIEVPVIAGRFVRGINAVWDKSSGSLDVGAPLEADRVVRLRQGTAEIAFDGGARVFLQGPAQFELSSPMAGILRYGSLLTEVPKEAKGFVVETPRASIVDYGTSFSLNVDPDDKTEEAFVHEGEIHVGIGDAEEGGKQIVKKLLKGQGVRIDADAGGKSVMRDISMPSGNVPPLKLKALQPRLPNEVGGLRLWLKADAGTFQDVEGKVPAAPGDGVARWIDQSGNGLNPRQRVPRLRPIVVADDHGRLALRFDRKKQQRLEEPLQTGPLSRVLDSSDRGQPQFTICVVFSTAKTHTRYAQALFSQFPYKSPHTSRYFGIGQDGELFYSEFPPTGIHLQSAEGTVVPNQTCIAVLTRDGNTQSIHLGGKLLVSNDHAERYAGNEPCRWWIGARYRRPWKTRRDFFQGNVYELIIFSRALPEQTRASIEAHLKDKYLARRPEEPSTIPGGGATTPARKRTKKGTISPTEEQKTHPDPV